MFQLSFHNDRVFCAFWVWYMSVNLVIRLAYVLLNSKYPSRVVFRAYSQIIDSLYGVFVLFAIPSAISRQREGVVNPLQRPVLSRLSRPSAPDHG